MEEKDRLVGEVKGRKQKRGNDKGRHIHSG